MKVVFHIGAPFTDNDILVQSLRRNRVLLSAKGICVPVPKTYKKILRDLSHEYRGRTASPDVERELILAISGDAWPDVLFLSNSQFISANSRIFDGAQIWPQIQRSCKRLTALFPNAEIEFALAIQNPETLIPKVLRNLESEKQKSILKELQPKAIMWSEVLNRLLMKFPKHRVTVWKDEDAPLLWGSVLRKFIGTDEAVPIRGEQDMMQSRLPNSVKKEIEDFIKENRIIRAREKKRVAEAFFRRQSSYHKSKYNSSPANWSVEEKAELAKNYQQDIEAIQSFDAIDFIGLT